MTKDVDLAVNQITQKIQSWMLLNFAESWNTSKGHTKCGSRWPRFKLQNRMLALVEDCVLTVPFFFGSFWMGGLNTIDLTSNWIFQNLMRRCCSTGKDIVFIYQGKIFAEDLIFDQKKKNNNQWAVLVMKVKSLRHFLFILGRFCFRNQSSAESLIEAKLNCIVN